jgi:hypothetical protein
LGRKKAQGRQLARVSAIHEHETIWSEVFPGNTHTAQCFKPAVEATETALDLSTAQRKRSVWRMDGGAGTDEDFRWLLARGYQVLAKGISNRRADALAQQVRRWDLFRHDCELAEVPSPVDFGRPVRMFLKRKRKAGEWHYTYYVSTLTLPSKTSFLQLYDDRGGAEIEQFRNDKDGLNLDARRKRSFTGQQGYILLTDLAHNLLADFAFRALLASPFADYGPKRIVRDLLHIPGRLVFDASAHRLIQVSLLSQNQFAKDLVICLLRYCTEA